MKKLENKVAIITGATSGMGKAIAITFVANGAKVILSGRDEINYQMNWAIMLFSLLVTLQKHHTTIY